MQNKMHRENNRLASFKLKSISAAVLSVMVVAHASAAGLGKLTILSGLGQPLRAEIELTAVSQDEARTLQPKLASLDAFRQANIDFVPTLYSLRFAIEQRGTRQLIRVTSTEVMREPFVDVLLELNGANGRLVREYTFLLDPPELRASQAPQVAPIYAPEVASSAPQSRIPMPSSTENTERPPKAAARQQIQQNPRAQVLTEPRARQAKAAVTKPGTSQYQVRYGDSLSKIADRTKPEGVSLDQMLVGLYRANPDAFVGKNMNRLRSGRILSIPTAETANSVNAPNAHGIVIAQAVDFNEYRNKLAGQVATGTAQKSLENRQSAAGKIAARVEEKPSAANDSLDKLKLSKPDAAAAGKAAALQEEKVAREKATADSAARVKDLEKNVSELQKLLEIKNKDLAERQKQADASKAQTPSLVAANVAASKVAVAEAKSAIVPPAPAPAPAPAAAVVAPVLPTKASTVAAPPVAATGVSPGVKPATVTTPSATVVPAPVRPIPETASSDSPLGNPMVQGGIGLLALLLGGFAFYRSRNKRTMKNFQDTNIPDSSLKANSLFGSTGGQSVDTNNSVFNSSFAPSPQTLDTNEVDPVAEADVYIAYGRDAQAEEILKEALRTQPERQPVRLKLLEIYASRKDTRAFESVATEMYSMTKGDGDEWAQAAGMGIALDAANPLYANGKASDNLLGQPSGSIVDVDATDDNEELASLLDEVSAIQPVVASSAVSDTKTEPIQKSHEVKPAEQVKAPGNIDDSTAASAIPGADGIPSAGESETASLSALDFDFLKSNTIQTPVPIPLESNPVTIADFNIGDDDFSIDDSGPATGKKEPDGALLVEPMHDEHNKPLRPDPMAFDLSGITLDLPDSNVHSIDEEEAKFSTGMTDSGDTTKPHEFTSIDLGETDTKENVPADSMISNSAEMATKLDLAVAYQEIGDKEGARELLDEVVIGGTVEQADKAKALLGRLG
jgi:pilus assembly protein FimV